jgi:hypothetical protein
MSHETEMTTSTPTAARSGAPGCCGGCGEYTWLLSLHGEKGGPLRCFKCAGEWNAIHGRRRKAGRIVIKALKLFEAAGGILREIDKLKVASWGIPVPGYDDADTIGAEIGDITSELLEDVLKLCHPDKHPAERKQLADRVTQELLALKPFVFPAPKPRPEPPEPRDGSLWDFQKPTKDPLRLTYPCADCAGEAPYFYCDVCKAEWEKRYREECEREAIKRRERYRAWRERHVRSIRCLCCEKQFKQKRTDQKFCSNACRQRHHRKRVTDKRRLSRENKNAVTRTSNAAQPAAAPRKI